MKKNFTIFFLLISSFVFSQKQYKHIDKLFNAMRYVEAAKKYEKALKKTGNSMELLQKAGDAYYFNTNMVKANKIYDQLITLYQNDVDPEYLFKYAHSLQGIGNNKEAKKWMKLFAKKSAKKDNRIESYAQNKKTLNDVINLPKRFKLDTLTINTIYSDFGPAYYNNKLIYASAVDTSFYVKRRYHWNNQPFLSLFSGQINATGLSVTKEKAFSKTINTKYHEATLVFTKDLKRVYFTRNNYNGDLGRDDNGVNHLKLYTATLDNDFDQSADWSNIEELPFNSENYSVGHPALSPDGKKLYFVSDMPGTIGGTDIFVVDILANNTYSTPKNLGRKINTSGREMFPFIIENTLYFASDGHLGLGGLDVYESELTDYNFTQPINLGLPLNSKKDDFGFIMDQSRTKGFVCSNRPGGQGDDDIYAYTLVEPLEKPIVNNCEQILKGYVTNLRTQERIANVNLTLHNESGEQLAQTRSKFNGDYEFNFKPNCDKRYEIRVEKTGYDPNNKMFVTSAISEETIIPLDMKTIDALIVEDNGLLKIKVGIIFFNTDKDYIRPDAAVELNKIVTLMSQEPNIKIRIESHTDSRARDAYNLDLSQRRANSTKAYLVNQGIEASRIIEAKGFGETRLMNNCTNGVKCEKAQHQLNRRSEFIIDKI